MTTAVKTPTYTQCQAALCHNLLGPSYKSGPSRKWCSNKCRKTKYAGTCVDCGATLSGCNGHGHNAPRRCHACAAAHRAVISGRASVALEMWRLRETEGLLNTAIAQRIGRTTYTVATELCRMRVLGFAVPKATYQGAGKRTTTPIHVDRSCAALMRELARMGVYPPDIGLPWRTATTREVS